jgi:hypothetical protein
MKKSITNKHVARALILFFLTCALMVMSSHSFAQNAPGQNFSASNTRANQISTVPGSRRVFVRSKALLVRAAVVEEKLMKRPEFTQLGLAITRDESTADIILELRHDVLTKYVYSAVDTKTQTVLAGGKVSSLGGTVAGKIAKRFVKQLERGRP